MVRKTIAIIPARGQSKRLPRKNIKPLLGKPLIFYSIAAAKKTKGIHRVIVTTEDQEIAQISNKYGAEVIKRPEHLATDATPTVEALIHAVNKLEQDEEYQAESIVLLQPTSPLRTVYDIEQSIELFQAAKRQKCSVISVCPFSHPPQWALTIENDLLEPIFGSIYLKKRSQELKKAYLPNGSIFIASTAVLVKERTFYTDNIIPYIMPRNRSIDIDSALDFDMAKFLLMRQKHLTSDSK